MAEKDLKIDLDQVIKNKSPKLWRLLPGFIIKKLKKIIHQDELNRIISDHKDLKGIEFVRAALVDLRIEHSVEFQEELNPEKRYVLAANHPFGGLDGLIIADIVDRKMGDVKLIVNDLLMNVYNTESLFVPVNKHGKQNPDNARLINDLYRSNTPIINFPAGLCSRKIKGKVTDLEWKKNFIYKSISYERDIVPVYVEGTNSKNFYRIAALRRFFRIKFNIEMIWLVDELMKKRGEKINIKIGKPVSSSEIKNSGLSHKEWTEKIREMVYNMQ